MKGFKVVNYISFPFPKLCLAQLMQPRRIILGGQLRDLSKCLDQIPYIRVRIELINMREKLSG